MAKGKKPEHIWNPKNPSKVKSEWIQIRVSPEEKKQVKSLAKKFGGISGAMMKGFSLLESANS